MFKIRIRIFLTARLDRILRRRAAVKASVSTNSRYTLFFSFFLPISLFQLNPVLVQEKCLLGHKLFGFTLVTPHEDVLSLSRLLNLNLSFCKHKRKHSPINTNPHLRLLPLRFRLHPLNQRLPGPPPMSWQTTLRTGAVLACSALGVFPFLCPQRTPVLKTSSFYLYL